jgi:hypothetical protein
MWLERRRQAKHPGSHWLRAEWERSSPHKLVRATVVQDVPAAAHWILAHE